jgi:hypothetical protein
MLAIPVLTAICMHPALTARLDTGERLVRSRPKYFISIAPSHLGSRDIAHNCSDRKVSRGGCPTDAIGLYVHAQESFAYAGCLGCGQESLNE